MSTAYTYYLHGGPAGELRTAPNQPDEPGHVLQVESRVKPNTINVYVLEGKSEAFRTANYKYLGSGTPEEAMEWFAELAERWAAEKGAQG